MPSIKPDYGMGPYQALMAAAVSLARQDRDDPKYSEEARAFLRSPLVESFAESLGYGGSFE